MVWSQTNQVFKIKTMRFFGWSIWDAAAIGWFSCIQCRGKKVWIQRKSQNAQNECNTMRQSPSYTCGHVHGNRLCPTENKAIQSMRLCDVSCVFFYSRKWEKKANVLFSDFRVFFFISMNVSLCTLIKKYTLNRTNNHGQRRQSWQKKKRICSASLQIRVKFKSTNWK